MQRIRTLTREGARLHALTLSATCLQKPTLRAIALAENVDYTVNGATREHYVMDLPSFGPALTAAVDRMVRLQMSCDTVVNNGRDPSDEFVKAMKLLWRQPLHLAPALPRVHVVFPNISNSDKPFDKMDVRVSCL